MSERYQVAGVVFPGFELLDLFGPLEMLGMCPDRFSLSLVAEHKGAVASAQGPSSLADRSFDEDRQYDLLLVPGGIGTRTQVDNRVLLDWLVRQARGARHVTSVCTGSALLARAGLLDGLRATSNKRALDWVITQGPRVDWQRSARWVEAGTVFTASGVSAGMDMTLALMEKLLGSEAAEQAAVRAEYRWQRDPRLDPFSVD